jgi:predicted RNase H-like nuclease (RuvC/YqgF family)
MFDFDLWQKEHDRKLTELMIKYYRQVMFHYSISDDALDHVKDAFIVGYKCGSRIKLERELDDLAQAKEETFQQENKLNRWANRLAKKERRLEEARKEILELKRGLLASFTIKDVTYQGSIE